MPGTSLRSELVSRGEADALDVVLELSRRSGLPAMYSLGLGTLRPACRCSRPCRGPSVVSAKSLSPHRSLAALLTRALRAGLAATGRGGGADEVHGPFLPLIRFDAKPIGRAMKEVAVFPRTKQCRRFERYPIHRCSTPEISAVAKDHAACRPSEEWAAELWARGVGGQPLRSVFFGRGSFGEQVRRAVGVGGR
jgi:hypothetical protein